VVDQLFRVRYRDEFDHLVEALHQELSTKNAARLLKIGKPVWQPREQMVFEEELRKYLAITPNGEHIEGAIGRVQVGRRFMRNNQVLVETKASIRQRKARGLKLHVAGRTDREVVNRPVNEYWPIYAGEAEERTRNGGGVADSFPDWYLGPPLSAAVAGISNEAALAACDAIVDLVDEGSSNGTVGIYADTRATDVDTAVGSQVLCARLAGSDPFFGNAADAAPGGRATANAITADTSADATDTATWFRVSATNDGSTPLDDHIDGNVGTSDADMVLNTVAIVAGAEVNINSYTFTVGES